MAFSPEDAASSDDAENTPNRSFYELDFIVGGPLAAAEAFEQIGNTLIQIDLKNSHLVKLDI